MPPGEGLIGGYVLIRLLLYWLYRRGFLKGFSIRATCLGCGLDMAFYHPRNQDTPDILFTWRLYAEDILDAGWSYLPYVGCLCPDCDGRGGETETPCY